MKTFKQDISNITDTNQRMTSLLGIASIAVTMRWDEEYRAQHNNIPIETNVTETVITLQPKFLVLLTTLGDSLKAVSGLQTLENNSYLSGFYSSVSF